LVNSAKNLRGLIRSSGHPQYPPYPYLLPHLKPYRLPSFWPVRRCWSAAVL